VFPVRYELGFSIAEEGILHSHQREHLKSCIIARFNYKIGKNKKYYCLTVMLETCKEQNIASLSSEY
jgi:hypothetical protein